MKAAILMGLALLCSFAIIIYYETNEKKRWEVFKVEHKCFIVEKSKSSTGIGFGPSTNGTLTTLITNTPATTSWRCDDGITYTR